tara:strand:- start:9702 stop:11222 length:1521 start_codon:yes stop_codon:yes gene_type:complete
MSRRNPQVCDTAARYPEQVQRALRFFTKTREADIRASYKRFQPTAKGTLEAMLFGALHLLSLLDEQGNDLTSVVTLESDVFWALYNDVETFPRSTAYQKTTVGIEGSGLVKLSYTLTKHGGALVGLRDDEHCRFIPDCAPRVHNAVIQDSMHECVSSCNYCGLRVPTLVCDSCQRASWCSHKCKLESGHSIRCCNMTGSIRVVAGHACSSPCFPLGVTLEDEGGFKILPASSVFRYFNLKPTSLHTDIPDGFWPFLSSNTASTAVSDLVEQASRDQALRQALVEEMRNSVMEFANRLIEDDVQERQDGQKRSRKSLQRERRRHAAQQQATRVIIEEELVRKAEIEDLCRKMQQHGVKAYQDEKEALKFEQVAARVMDIALEALAENILGDQVQAVAHELRELREAQAMEAAQVAEEQRRRLEQQRKAVEQEKQERQLRLAVKRREQQAEQERQQECIICLDAKKCVACVPCGHVVACLGCQPELERAFPNECPTCRVPRGSLLRIF